MRLRTDVGELLYEVFRPSLRTVLLGVDSGIGFASSPVIDSMRDQLEHAGSKHADDADAVLDDLYVLGQYVEFFSQYANLWRLVAEERFSESWGKLQDAMDALRVVRRHSAIDIDELENQLVELEKTYPYNIFFSIGAVVERFECSICGRDIDSLDCPHRRGHLYRGRMAVGIAHNVVRLDHVAMVDQPRDRRCVVSYEDSGEQFKVVRLLSRLLQGRTYSVSDFGVLLFSKRLQPNPEYKKLGRNEPCYCNSGVKFKRCCIAESQVITDHVDIAPRTLLKERAVV